MSRFKYQRYGLLSKGSLPKNGFIRFEDNIPDGYYAVAVYNRMLSEKEVKRYKLTDLNSNVNKLTRQRLLAGMKQNELAELTELSIRTIQGWELNGIGGAAVNKVYRVSKVLSCSIEDLIDDEDLNWTPDTSKDFEA